MKYLARWDHAGLPPRLWADWSLRLQANLARGLSRCERGGLTLLDWGRRYLPQHFRRQPSGMHLWLAERFDEMSNARGSKLNVIGPRGGAKSTLGTLTHALRAARRRLGAVHLDRL